MLKEIPAKKKLHYAFIVAASAFGIWVTMGTLSTYGVFLKPIAADFGWSRAATAGGRSLAAAFTGLGGVIAGRLTDRFGPRKVLLIFGSMVGIGYLLMSRITSLWQYYLVYGVIVGFGFSAGATPTLTTIGRWFVKRRGLVTGIVQAGSSLGGMVLAPLAGWLIVTRDWHVAFLILGIVTLAILVVSAWGFRRDPAEMGELPYGAEEPSDRGANKRQGAPPARGLSARQALGTRQFWMLCGVFFAFGLSRQTILTHVAAHATDLGLSLTTGAAILAIISAAAIFGRIGMGQVSDMLGSRRVYMISFSLMLGALLWLLVAGNQWMLYLFAVAFGFAWGGLAVVRMPIMAEIFGISSLGAILGMAEVGTSAGSVLGPFFGGWLFDLTGQYTVSFLATAASVSMALVLIIVLRPIGHGHSKSTAPAKAEKSL